MTQAGYSRGTTVFDTRIALVSTGLSHIHRGYETFIADLYEALKDVGSVSLYKGSGWSTPPGTNTVPCLRRNDPMVMKFLPDEVQRYNTEQTTMALSGWMNGYWQNASIIHFCDPGFGNVLWHLRRVFKYNYQLLFANCGPLDPQHYQRFDHIQEFTPDALQKAKQHIRKTRLHLIPMGCWVERFRLEEEKAKLREAWGIPKDKFVILCVASLDEAFKRVPFLIDTVAALNDSRIYLMLAGENRETDHAKAVLAQAENKLAGRYQHALVPYARIPELYNAADLFMLPSLSEGFGKVYLEAMASGTPLLCHDYSNTQWIVRSPDSLVDMTDPEAVMAAIRRMQDESGTGQSVDALAMAEMNRQCALERFHWKQLRQEYMDMYERIMVLPV